MTKPEAAPETAPPRPVHRPPRLRPARSSSPPPRRPRPASAKPPRPRTSAAPAEGDIVAASATYDSHAPARSPRPHHQEAPRGRTPNSSSFAELVTCAGPHARSPKLGLSPFPAVVLRASYAQTEAEVYAGTEAEQEPHPGEHTGGIEGVGHAPKTVVGTTTTMTETAPQLLNRPYNCVRPRRHPAEIRRRSRKR